MKQEVGDAMACAAGEASSQAITRASQPRGSRQARQLMEAVLALRLHIRQDVAGDGSAALACEALLARWHVQGGEVAPERGLATKIAERLHLACQFMAAGDSAGASGELTRAYMLMCCARAGLATPQSARLSLALRR